MSKRRLLLSYLALVLEWIYLIREEAAPKSEEGLAA